MGYYVNPKGETKEAFLNRVGIPMTMKEVLAHDNFNDRLVVCLVNNGPFTAAGICYSKNELLEFADPKDQRPKKWYEVSEDLLLQVSNLPRR